MDRGVDMKSIAIAFIGILLLGLAPAAATAQGMYDGPPMAPPMGVGGPPTPLMPPPMGVGGPPTPLMPPPGMAGPGACGVPPMPYGCQPPCQKPVGSAAFYAGYLFSSKQGVKYTREASDGSQPDLVFKFPVQGALLGLSLDAYVGDCFGITGAGAVLIPAKTQGDFDQEGFGAIALNSSVDADNQLGMLQGGAFYKFYDAGWGSFQALGGFRWDHFSSKQTFVFRDAAGTVSLNTTNNLTIDAYLPYVGVGLSQTTPCSYFNARVIGFPVVPGNVTLQDSFTDTETGAAVEGGGEYKSAFKNGYFVEFFGEYAVKLLGDFFVGGFGAYDILYGKTGEDQFVALGQAPLSERIVLTRRTWTLGGTVALKF